MKLQLIYNSEYGEMLVLNHKPPPNSCILKGQVTYARDKEPSRP